MRFWPRSDDKLGYPPFMWEGPGPASNVEVKKTPCKCESCGLARRQMKKRNKVIIL